MLRRAKRQGGSLQLAVVVVGCALFAAVRWATFRPSFEPVAGPLLAELKAATREAGGAWEVAAAPVPGTVRQPALPPPAPPAPPPEDDPGFESTVRGRAANGAVLLLGGSRAYVSLLDNAVCRLAELRVTNFVVVAYDGDVYAHFRREGVPCVRALGPDGSPADTPDGGAYEDGQGGGEFRAVTKLRCATALRVLRLGVDALVVDADVYLLHSPFLAMQTAPPNVDISAQSDRRPEQGQLEHSLSSGLFYARANRRSVAALEQVVADGAGRPGEAEEASFNRALCGERWEFRRDVEDPNPPHLGFRALPRGPQGANGDQGDKPRRWFDSWCENPRSGAYTRILDQDSFHNGDTWDWANARPREVGVHDPIAVHANWCRGLVEKVGRLRLSGFWRLDGRGRCLARAFPGVRLPVAPVALPS